MQATYSVVSSDACQCLRHRGLRPPDHAPEIVIRQVITITSVTGANVRFPVCKLGGKLVPPERLPGLGQEDTNPRFGNQAAPRVMN